MEEKKCSKCGEVKCISEYGVLRGKVGGMPRCKVCSRKRSLEYLKKNYDKIKIQREQNKNYNNKYQREYRRNRYNSDNEFKWVVKVMDHVRGASNRQEFKDKWDSVRQDYEKKGITYHIDHMIPREWFKTNTNIGLVNHIDNLQVIDAEYNLNKKNFWSDPVPSDYLDKVRPYIKKKYLGLLKSL